MKKKLLSILASAIFMTQGMCYVTASADTTSVSPFISKTYTHGEVAKGKYIYNGIDVSKYQPTIDWAKVKAAGVDFVFIRLGYRGYGSTGALCLDPYFESHINGALNAGLKVGVYYYTEAINTTEAVEEAKYCIDKLANYNITLPVAYDFETTTVGGVKTGRKYKAKLSKTAATKNCKAFCDTIKAAGYTPMVYANKSDLTNLIDGASLEKSYDIWLANYTTKTSYTGKYSFWQYTSSGKVNGINSSAIDCNFWYSSTPIDSLNSSSIKNATVSSIPDKVYSGKAYTPKPTVTLHGKKLTLNKDYKLTYSSNKAIGKATIKITGTGDYTGSKTTSFKILPKKIASFQKKSSSKKAIKLKWKKDTAVTGYTIYRKTTSSGTSYKKVATLPKKTTTWHDTSLKKNREYYYRIRSYKTVNGKNYYGDYTYLTTATTPGGKKLTLTKKAKLYKVPATTGKVLVTIPANSKITYLGRTYVTNAKQTYHVKYTVKKKVYEGYLPIKASIKF